MRPSAVVRTADDDNTTLLNRTQRSLSRFLNLFTFESFKRGICAYNSNMDNDMNRNTRDCIEYVFEREDISSRS